MFDETGKTIDYTPVTVWADPDQQPEIVKVEMKMDKAFITALTMVPLGI